MAVPRRPVLRFWATCARGIELRAVTCQAKGRAGPPSRVPRAGGGGLFFEFPS